MSVILTIEELRTTYLPKWQRILRLQDWEVWIDIKRQWDFESDLWTGQNNFIKEKRMSRIMLLDPVDWKESSTPVQEDMELTLVHELVHLHLVEWQHKTKEEIFEEQAVHAIASALILLDRRDRWLVNTPI